MTRLAERSLRISHVGLRGVVGSALTANHALDFASAFATFLEPGGCVIVGRDPRASGLMMREAVVSALLAWGRAGVVRGFAPPPFTQHSTRRRAAGGGFSIGPSHNSAEW